MRKIWNFILSASASLLLLLGCGGGFGTDSDNASEIGPGIFEPDTAR